MNEIVLNFVRTADVWLVAADHVSERACAVHTLTEVSSETKLHC